MDKLTNYRYIIKKNRLLEDEYEPIDGRLSLDELLV